VPILFCSAAHSESDCINSTVVMLLTKNLSKKGQIDWRKHKEDTAQQRKRQKQAWLYEEEGN
jgi:hypothetical protein